MKLLLLVIPFIFISCSRMPQKIDALTLIKDIKKNSKLQLSIMKGDTLNKVINTLKFENPNLIIVNKLKGQIIFDRDLNMVSFEDLAKYIRLTQGRIIKFRKFSENLYSIEEVTSTLEMPHFDEPDFSMISTQEVEVNGEFTYAQVFNLFRKYGVELYIQEADNSYTESSSTSVSSSRTKGATFFSVNEKTEPFKGTLRNFIKTISNKYHLFVNVNSPTDIELFNYKTVTYDLQLPTIFYKKYLNGEPMNEQSIKEIDSQDLNPLKDLAEQIKAVSRGSARFSINQTQGTVTLSGNREDLLTIQKIIQNFHKIYSKSIKLNLNIYEVALNDSRSFGIDYNLLKNSFLNNDLLSVNELKTSLSSQIQGANVLTVSQKTLGLEGDMEGQNNNIIFKALNTFGRTSLIRKTALETVNNLPTNFKIKNQLDYVYNIRSTSTSAASNGTAVPITQTTQPEIKTIDTGFFVELHPKIKDDYVTVGFKSKVILLNNLNKYEYGNKNIISLKNTTERKISEIVKLREGDIAIIGGYIYNKQKSLKNGLPFTTSSDSPFDSLTSAKNQEFEKVEIIITLSAEISEL